MLTKPYETADIETPESHILTEEETRDMKESLAREYFDMSLDEFTKAWQAGELDDDRERHGDVMFLAAMLPEAWTK